MIHLFILFRYATLKVLKGVFTGKNPRNRILWPKDKFDMTLHEFFCFVSDPGGRSDLDYHMDSSFNEVSP